MASPQVKRTCLECGEEFFVSLSYLQRRKGHGNFCSISCCTTYYNKLGIMGRKRDSAFIACEVCGKVFKVSKRQIERDNTRFCSRQCRGKAQSIYQMREHNPSWKNTPELVCQNCGRRFLAYSREPGRIQRFCSRPCYLAHVKKINAFATELLTNQRREPSFVHKMIVGQNRKPTIPERKLDKILSNNFPGEWKYTGDGSLTVGNYWPDFSNCNGEKNIIELFGDYWHSDEKIKDDWRRSELGKIMTYNSFGFRCLVIWEHELNELPEETIVERIRKFNKEPNDATKIKRVRRKIRATKIN